MKEKAVISNELTKVRKHISLSDYDMIDLSVYPDLALDYALNVTLRKPRSHHNVAFFHGVVRRYCMQKGIVVGNERPVPDTPDLLPKAFSPHGEGKQTGYVPIYPKPPVKPTKSREALIQTAYPHLSHGEYDDIKQKQADGRRFIDTLKTKAEIQSIKGDLFNLMSRLTNKRKVEDEREDIYNQW